ncbi:MAG TPA: cytochrome C oxidase subunit IV family protein [Rhodocyclaceae bacterium]
MNGRRFYRRNLGVGILLMLLLAATTASAYVPMGAWNTVVNFAIAAAKIGLVAAFFMHLLDADALLRIAAAVALLMLSIFLTLASTDYLARRISPAPWQGPHVLRPSSPAR